MNQYHLWLLYKTCVIPVLTYSCQLWFNTDKPNKHLLLTLQWVQNNALRRITGSFRTAPIEALQLLSHVPPLHITVRKLTESAALHTFWLPLSSEIVQCLPSPYIPVSVPRPIHIPFTRPHLRHKIFSHLTNLIRYMEPDTERLDPFHSHCTPYMFQLSSSPFEKLRIRHLPVPKERKQQCSDHHETLFQEFKDDPHSIFLVTDGSKCDNCTGYSVILWYRGKIAKKIMVPFAKHASAFNAKMYALAYTSSLIWHVLTLNPALNEVYLLSNCSSILQVIFDPSPHPSQVASIQFRTNMLAIMTTNPNIKIDLEWMPGHGGSHMMKVADCTACAVANPKSKRCSLVSFTLKSSAVQDINTTLCTRWRFHLDHPSHEIPESSGFYLPRTSSAQPYTLRTILISRTWTRKPSVISSSVPQTMDI